MPEKWLFCSYFGLVHIKRFVIKHRQIWGHHHGRCCQIKSGMWGIAYSVSPQSWYQSLGVTKLNTLSFNALNEVYIRQQPTNKSVKLRYIRKYFCDDYAKQIAVWMVSARLDYCNDVLLTTLQSKIPSYCSVLKIVSLVSSPIWGNEFAETGHRHADSC